MLYPANLKRSRCEPLSRGGGRPRARNGGTPREAGARMSDPSVLARRALSNEASGADGNVTFKTAPQQRKVASCQST